jgi:predicted AlkP superfamily phosphohydrolase/phosphomutase
MTELVRKLIWSIGLQGLPTFLRRQLYRLGMGTLAKVPVTAKVPDLDWGATQAWVQSASGDLAGYADIFLDESMTEEQIHGIIADLWEIRDPETGQFLLADIHREDAFGSGPFAPQERHLMLIAAENTALRVELGRRNLWDTCKPYGIHHPDGVLYLYGAGVKRGITIAPAHVYDIVPTILSSMQLPVPETLEGHVIAEAFEPSLPPSFCSDKESAVTKKLKKLSQAP